MERPGLNLPDLVKGVAGRYRDKKGWRMGGQTIFAWGHVYLENCIKVWNNKNNILVINLSLVIFSLGIYFILLIQTLISYPVRYMVCVTSLYRNWSFLKLWYPFTFLLFIFKFESASKWLFYIILTAFTTGKIPLWVNVGVNNDLQCICSMPWLPHWGILN